MMKDVDAYSRHFSTLVYQYLATTYFMHRRDIISRPYTYNYYVFHNCTNPRNVSDSITTLVFTSFSILVPRTFLHSSLRLFQSPSILHLSTQPLSTKQYSLHPKRLLGYHSTQLSLLSVHFSIVGLVVQLIFFFRNKFLPSLYFILYLFSSSIMLHNSHSLLSSSLPSTSFSFIQTSSYFSFFLLDHPITYHNLPLIDDPFQIIDSNFSVYWYLP